MNKKLVFMLIISIFAAVATQQSMTEGRWGAMGATGSSSLFGNNSPSPGNTAANHVDTSTATTLDMDAINANRAKHNPIRDYWEERAERIENQRRSGHDIHDRDI
jgi:hypothetical protein